MSGSVTALLHQQLADGNFEQAANTAQKLNETQTVTFTDFAGALHHAMDARQEDIAVALLEGSKRFAATGDPALYRQLVAEMTAVLATSWREKLDKPARTAVTLVLELIEKADRPVTDEMGPILVRFASWGGRFALRRNDMEWFGEIALQSAGWVGRHPGGLRAGMVLPVFDAWLHRMLRQERIAAIPVFFESLSLVLAAETEKKVFFQGFLTEFRVVATLACLNVKSPMVSQLMEELLLFVVRADQPEFWPLTAEMMGEVAILSVAKHGVQAGFPVFRPLLDIGRVNLNDELKFGTGHDPASPRQRIIRHVCAQTLKIMDVAAHGDMVSVAGDKIEEVYRSWINDPQYEPHIRSIQRFCQLLLIFWANNRKRAAKKWTPREQALSEPLLLTEEEREKLSFLL